MNYKFSFFEIILLVITSLLLIWVIFSLVIATSWSYLFNSDSISDFGSFMGGLFAGLNIFYLIKTLQAQHRTASLQSFETNYIELLKFTRLQLDNAKVLNPNAKTKEYILQKEVINCFLQQVELAISIVQNYVTTENHSSIFISSDTFSKENSHWGDKMYERTIINIAFTITYIGVASVNYEILKSKYLAKYNADVVESMLKEFRMQLAQYAPKLDNTSPRLVKTEIQKCEDKMFLGFQNEVGNYFRMLYQTVSFVNEQQIPYAQKYKYIKMLRGQMSIAEETLLYYNSLSDFGLSWEKRTNDPNNWLITKYNFIKNIPYGFVAIDPVGFYPDVFYEYMLEPPKKREKLAFF